MVIIYLNKLKVNLRSYYLTSLFIIISKISNNKEPLGISISKNQEGALILPISFMTRRIL